MNYFYLFPRAQCHTAGTAHSSWVCWIMNGETAIDMLVDKLSQPLANTLHTPSAHLLAAHTANNTPGLLMSPGLTSKLGECSHF